MNDQKRLSQADIIKFIGLLLFFVLLAVIGWAIWPYFAQLGSDEGRMQLIASIQDAGILGVLVCLGLQFVQIVIAFIPGEVTQLAIGAIYGPIGGTLVTALGALISSAFVFFVVRRLGAPFVHSMIGKKHEGILKYFQDSKQLDVIVFILFLIPGLPKDIFTYLVPITDMRATNFLILSTLGRLPAIAASAFIGNAAIQGDYTSAIIVSIVAGGLGILGIVFNGRIMQFVDNIQKRFSKNSAKNSKELYSLGIPTTNPYEVPKTSARNSSSNSSKNSFRNSHK
ncbi:MAG: TVP38/TMEM64 family protein [Coriobacteriales bacterium]|jgi:uncharacterized membrane protein YdjX (TVP38/TMEM64 family)|nr:TVP38/TMEM64 family protein [Coriobacteriales bacterium]